CIGGCPLQLHWENALSAQTRVQGSILHAPLVTAAGTLVVASTTGVTELDGNGARVFTHALGRATPVTAPAIAPDGSRIVVTSSAELVVLTPSGAVSAKHRLPIDARSVHPTLVVTASGTVLLGAADGVLEVTLEGDVLVRVPLTEMPVSLLDLGARRLVVTGSGDVLEWRVTDPPRKIASFGGEVRGQVAVAPGGELVAVVGRTRLVSIDLDDGTQRVRLVASGFSLPAPPALTSGGETRLLTSNGQILGHDPRGREVQRSSLGGVDRGPRDRGGPGEPSTLPAPLVDDAGRVVAAWPDRPLSVIDREGRLGTSEEGAACAQPVALLALAPRAVVLACASGVVSCFGTPRPPRTGPGG
ncbi:MAG TPA: hypothetical protein PLU22_22860, partial [Polyangiaceae bacterium]|nr:hypothetical protein [Polyangiaceae bacterium]